MGSACPPAKCRLAVLLPLAFFASAATLAGTVVVQTPDGSLLGARASERTVAFRSVPYATAARWSPPVPVRPWQGVLNATANGPRCIDRGTKGVGREDCLTLSITTPANLTMPRRAGASLPLLPVVVFIHGGCFINNGGLEPQDFNQSEFVEAAGDVLLVVPNCESQPRPPLCTVIVVAS